MHLFSLWYCRILGDQAPPGLLEKYRSRLAAFLPGGARLFGDNGAPLFQGRSLVYRFATTGAFWAGPLFEVDALAPGVVRRLGSGALRYFVEQGCYDENDLLSLGWHGRFEPMRQGYSGPGSPYWADLGFAGLLLGEEHPSGPSLKPSCPPRRRPVRDAGLVGRTTRRSGPDGEPRHGPLRTRADGRRSAVLPVRVLQRHCSGAAPGRRAGSDDPPDNRSPCGTAVVGGPTGGRSSWSRSPRTRRSVVTSLISRSPTSRTIRSSCGNPGRRSSSALPFGVRLKCARCGVGSGRPPLPIVHLGFRRSAGQSRARSRRTAAARRTDHRPLRARAGQSLRR